MTAPLDRTTMLARASTALGTVDLYGPRGVTMLSTDQIEAMALTLAALGLVPTPPGGSVPTAFFTPVEGGLK